MSSYSKMSDIELTTLLKRGDQFAYTEIHKRFRGLLYLYAFKLVRDEADAEDLVQEIFIYLWDKRATLNFQTALPAYLYSAVRFKFFNWLDHKKVRTAYQASFDDFTEKGEYITDLQIRENELTRLVEKEIAKLPAKMREVFELSRKSNLTQKEIAKQLNISDKTVKKQMNNALKILKVKLGSLFSIVFSIYL